MSSALLQFLNQYRCKPGESVSGKRTHYSIANPKGSYSIPPDQLAVFRTHYRNTIIRQKKTMHLVEANQDCTPIKIDLDFHYNLDDDVVKKGNTRIYTKKNIEEFLKLYMNTMEEYLISFQPDERLCIIMEKEAPVKNTKMGPNAWKDGLHFIFPKIVCHHSLQHLFRKNVLKQMWSCFPRGVFSNKWEDILDSHVIRSSGWQMLGSSKPNCSAYKISNITDVYNDRCVNKDMRDFEFTELLELTTMQGYSEKDCLPIRQEKKAEVEKRMASSKPSNQYKRNILPHVHREYGTHSSTADSATIDLVMKFVELLRPERAFAYGTWIELGWCLHNIHNADNKLLDVWIEYSKQSPRHAREAEHACKSAWMTMQDQGLGIGTLRMWAREDNRDGYQELIKNELFPKILRMCTADNGKLQPGDISELMAIMYRDQYVCIYEKPETWFRFSKHHHRWISTEPVTIRKEISGNVYSEFKDVHRIYSERATGEDDDKNHEIAGKVWTAMCKLRNPTFKGHVVHELMEPFYDDERKFFDTLNEKKHLIGLENGTYDLNTDTFRDGRPDDRITLNTKCIYPNMTDDSSEEWVMRRKTEIESFISKILPNRRVRTFVMTLLASFLSGDTNEEHFHIWTGSGGNGKSKLLELFESAIGEYACKLPVSLLTGKRQASSGATPELANLKGRRFACLQEPSEGSRIDAGLMKELTGGDKIYARALFKEPIEFKPQFKLILACNDPPELPKGDGGVWRRVKMVNFPAKFKSVDELTTDDGHWNADKTIWTPKDAMKPVFPADESIDQKFKEWKDVFLWMLLEQYKVYKKDGLPIPPEVKATTNDYRQTQFKLGEFIKDKIVIDTDCMEQHTIAEIYDQYKDWYMESQGGNKKEMLKRQDVAQYMESYFGEHLVSPGTYTHIRLNEDPHRAMGGGGFDTTSRFSGHVSIVPSDEASDDDIEGLEDET